MRYLLVIVAALAVAATSAVASPPRVPATLDRRAGLELEVVRELNRVRTQRGLPALRLADGLRRAAVSHSRAMLQLGFFDHASPDGTSFADRIRRHYPDRGWAAWSVAETLFAAYPEVDAEAVVAAWLGSAPHRDIVLSPTWRELGVGVLEAPFAPRAFGGRPTVVVTADFGSRAGSASRAGTSR
ncbi:MAG TPA: CAP domain-containing protein [Gaiellaceae bacterium]|nr:CAP domain-containing protein [Gaiellaceae bacterium]